MKIHWDKQLNQQPRLILEQAGYHEFVDPNTHKLSYIMRVSSQFYPRYHVYVKLNGPKVTVDLHIDQKKASYKGQRAHSGEYDGPLVEEEIARLKRWFTHFSV
jgi:hypothetical protein